MEATPQNSYWILTLPEVISTISSFLPVPDLKSCSLLNSTWKRVTRSYLDVLLPTSLSPNNLAHYVGLARTGSLYPANVCLSIPPYSTYEDMRPHLDSIFGGANFKTLTKLSIELPLNYDLRHVAYLTVKFCESLKNLKSLEWRPVMCGMSRLTSDDEWKELFPTGVAYPGSLVSFVVNVVQAGCNNPDISGWIRDTVNTLIPEILTFPGHIRHLGFVDATSVMRDDNVTLPELTFLSVKSSMTPAVASNPFSSVKNYGNLTTLEINAVTETDDITENILSLLAPQLENLCISGVLNVDPVKKPPDQEYLFLPILPRLKVLRILQRQFSLSESSTWFRPRLYLRFASGERLRYSEQFPVLGKLVVHVVPCHMGRGWDVPAENLHLEATMLLLQETFLAEGVLPSETVTNLDIPFRENVGRMKLRRRCDCDGACACWGWKEDDALNFYERVATIFPNVRYDVLHRLRRNERTANIAKFTNFGKKLGIWNDDEIKEMNFV
ncbi:uncharacterized protein LOC118437767 isoform X1 [Folsomia candida]|uniref:uncharacterized protein LOC118437767 isoform X1 n=1 Tax=Folsomia candida TaxID=158441 RepID=UPI00160543D2|nr:uncharacterized protein LOC118437767 isoform X1 [Folsomia candida]